MFPERWREIDSYLERILDLPDGERESELERICPDPDLRRVVLDMLARSQGVGQRLASAIEDSSHRAFDQAAPPQRLGPYLLLREIGAGGMGTVWLAERVDGEFQQQVAIKFIRFALAGERMKSRFLNERQILAGLHHPNIAQLLDGGTTGDGAPYLVMEYVPGVDLTAHAGNLPMAERLRLFLKVCGAVEHAHRNLVVHRDLKMSNILVTPEGEVKLLDFGIAKVLEDDAEAADRTATQLMTPEYASPEQVLGRPVTTLSDVYSLGGVLYVLLTGKSPYRTATGSAAEMVEAVARQEVVPPSTCGGFPPDDLDVIALKAMRKEPERRYQSVAELAADVRAFLEGRPVSARPDTLGYRARRFAGRNPWAAAATAASVVLLIAFVVGMLVQSRRLQTERDTARRERDNAQWLSNFLTGVFQVADPRQGEGDKVTARELLDRGARRIAAETRNNELRALVGTTIGRAYYGLGLLPAAEKAALDAHTAAKASGSAEARMQALTVIEDVYSELARPDQLMTFAREHEAVAGPGDSMQKARALTSQGSALELQRKFAEARLRHREALDTLTRIGQGQSTEAGTVLNNAANAEYNSGRDSYPAAMDYARRAVSILRKTGPNEQLMIALNSVSVVAMSTKDFQTAEPNALEALALARKMYGERHLNIGFNYSNLCGMYTLMKRIEPALGYCRQAVELRKEGFPAGHRLISISLNNWGQALLAAGRWDEALAAYGEAYPVLARENGGPAARSAEGLGRALKGKRDWRGSARYLREAVERWTRIGRTNNLDDLRQELAEVEALARRR